MCCGDVHRQVAYRNAMCFLRRPQSLEVRVYQNIESKGNIMFVGCVVWYWLIFNDIVGYIGDDCNP